MVANPIIIERFWRCHHANSKHYRDKKMKDPIFFTDQEEFSNWLLEHHKLNELWVGYYKKSTGKESLTWSESVDVALCFGWIDGIRKSIDNERYMIRFTPRNKNSIWSAVNVSKVNNLIKLGKMRPDGLTAFKNRSDLKGYSSHQRNIPFDSDYEKEIKANKHAWEFFNNLAPSYKRDTIWWVMSAKKKETQLRRLSILISSAQEGLKIPMLRKK